MAEAEEEEEEEAEAEALLTVTVICSSCTPPPSRAANACLRAAVSGATSWNTWSGVGG